MESEVVVMTSAVGEMVSVKLTLCVAAGVLKSVTIKVSGALDTATTGVPVIARVEESSDNPAGSVPAVIDQVYGGLPPWAIRFAE